MTTQQDLAGEPESYSSEDLALVPGERSPGAVSESPPSETGAPPPGDSPDPRIAEAEAALALARTEQAEQARQLSDFQQRDANTRFEAQVTQEVMRRQQQLVGQNWGEVEARQEAQSYGRAVIAERRISGYERQLEDAGRLVRAMQLEKETGTPAADLLPYSTPGEMERAARSRSTESKRISDLESEIAQMKQGIVPPGRPDSNTGTGGMSDTQLIAAAAAGEVVDMAKVAEALKRL